jgi:hypothetical protein
MLDWLSKHAWWMAILSGALGVLSMLIGFAILMRLPEDHFLRRAEGSDPVPSRSPVRGGMLILKNLAGIGIMIAGLIMALPLVPGPGLIMVIIGLSMTNFPWKRKLEVKILSAPLALDTVNWLRARIGRPPLRLPSFPGRPVRE